MEKVTKQWLEEYFELEIPPKTYKSFWRTEGGTGTWGRENIEDIGAEPIWETPSHSYWGVRK